MGLPNVFQTGRTGMTAAHASIATAGHNITNSNTENFSRQRVETAQSPTNSSLGSKAVVGSGTMVNRVERINDQYLEKQIREVGRELASLEEKDIALRQTEDIFNEMNGEGLNRLISRFFNEFRKLSNEPESEAVRQSVREASNAMINDFKRIRNSVVEVRKHLDSRLEGCSREANALATEIRDLNIKIRHITLSGAQPNDLLDKRDLALKKLATYADFSMYQDKDGNYTVDIRGVGPMVVGPNVELFSVVTSPADDQGKPEGALDLKTTGSAHGIITHQISGGRMGALLETRDKSISTILGRLDELAFAVTQSVNQIHSKGLNRAGETGIDFFKHLDTVDRAAEFFSLSDAVRDDVGNMATGINPDAPGDNRIAVAIANLQNAKVMNGGATTMDDWYNGIVADVGVATARNRSAFNQHKDIATQMSRMRDQISGVSIDEETANLLQFQHIFGASAKVIQVADECLKTVLELKR